MKKQGAGKLEEKAGENVRHGSAVPVSCHDVESCVLPVGIDKAWHIFKQFKLEEVMPNKVKETKYLQGSPNQVDSIVRITYVDGAQWEIRISEISDLKHSIAYYVLSTEPPHSVTSIIGQIVLRPVTDEEHTFVEWITDFSNDADAGVIEDQRFKKMDFFAEMKKTLG